MGKPIYVKWATIDKPIWVTWTNDHDVAQLPVETIPQIFERRKKTMGKSIFGKWANDYDVAWPQVETIPQNFKQRKSVQLIWDKLWPMGKLRWVKWTNRHNMTTTRLENSMELWLEKICPVVSEICITKCGPHWYQIWQAFGPWVSPWGKWANDMIQHNYRPRESCIASTCSNGANLSSGFRDMHSAICRPYWHQIQNVFGPWASQYGTNGQMIMTVLNYRSRQKDVTVISTL